MNEKQEHVAAFLAPLPARSLPGCGWSTNQQLQVSKYI